MKPVVWFLLVLLIAGLLILAGCLGKNGGKDDTQIGASGGTDTAPGETGTGPGQGSGPAVLRFSSFDGGGPEYRASAEDPTLVSWTVKRDYGSSDHDQQTGSPYDAVFTFTGLKAGTTVLTVVGSSPIVEPLSYRYTVTVGEDLTVTLRPIRTISRLTVWRNGDINYDSYVLAPEEGGYVLTVNEEEQYAVPQETVDAIYEVFERYEMAGWDGFSGSQQGVLDGEGFSLEIVLTDGTTVRASGDNTFPPNYFSAMGELWKLLTHAANPSDPEPAP